MAGMQKSHIVERTYFSVTKPGKFRKRKKIFSFLCQEPNTMCCNVCNFSY